MSQTFWKTLAWLSVICGLFTYGIGWIAVVSGGTFWNINSEFWFYDAIAAFMLGVFFLIYSIHYSKRD